MNTDEHRWYRAVWGRPLWWTSLIVTVVSLGGAVSLVVSLPGAQRWLAPLPVLMAGGAALFCIRGYAVEGDTLLIRRLFWTTRISVADLQSAAVVPQAMSGSLRTCGNGGLFSFTGWYWNRPLGSYRAWVTDLHNTVVLRIGGRTMVLSPEPAEAFVGDLQSRLPRR
jgi:hypothetical protein